MPKPATIKYYNININYVLKYIIYTAYISDSPLVLDEKCAVPAQLLDVLLEVLQLILEGLLSANLPGGVQTHKVGDLLVSSVHVVPFSLKRSH